MIRILCLILATLVFSCLAINNSPIDAIPYCRVVENGFTTDANGQHFRLSEFLCYPSVAFAVFYNGKDTGFDLNILGYISGFWIAAPPGYNGTINTNHPSVGMLFDLGSDDCRGGIGIMDGTFDAVDGALSITFDGKGYGGGTNTSNITTTCTSTSVSFTLGPDVLPKGLILKRTFYFPSDVSEAWGRVVDEVHNPNDRLIEVSIGYHSNVGSDDDTHYYNKTDGYSFTGDVSNVPGYPDNLVSLHWAVPNARYPNGFQTSKRFNNGTKMPPLVDGNDDIFPYWNVTIRAGETMTFMMIMNQGAWDVDKMYASVKNINSNPLKLYADMTDDQLRTLHNFNACTAAIPQVSGLTPKTACDVHDGKAMFDLTALLHMVPANTTVTALDVEGTVVATNDDTVLSLPSGTFSITIKYGPCNAMRVGQITVTCPSTVVPMTDNPPSAVNAPSMSTPITHSPAASVTSGASKMMSIFGITW